MRKVINAILSTPESSCRALHPHAYRLMTCVVALAIPLLLGASTASAQPTCSTAPPVEASRALYSGEYRPILNLLFPGKNFVSGQDLRNEATSTTAFCRFIGYTSATVAEAYSYSSPGDNQVIYWNGADFLLQPASQYNSYAYRIICSTPLPPCTPTPPQNTTQCNDGIDNDGDGRFDALVNGSTTSNSPSTFIISGDPHALTARVAAAGYPYLRVDLGSLLFDQGTAQRACEALGYNTVVSFDSRHADGRNGYSSPSNNLLYRWNAATGVFDALNAAAAGNRWLASLVCGGVRPACMNGVDDDRDGLIDLADPGCASATDASEVVHDQGCTSPADTTEAEQCRDGIDNDGDGFRDFPGDFSCANADDDDETNGRSQCQDGVDNDNDGLVDAQDPGCSTNQDNNEGDGTSQCQDGIDNDADGATDFPNDFSCSSRQDTDEINPRSACQDGADNDNDGLVDLADPGCANRQDNNEGDGTSQCQDGIDNDADGATDFPNDFSCSSRQDIDEINPRSACQDGADNDNDGLVDLADPGCANRQDNNEGDGTSQCQDGIDNDADGATDFPADFSCSSATDTDESNPKSGCQDGIDNDNDGLTDLADPGCSNNQDNNEGDKTSACQDGLDNDSDGAVDFPADFSCSGRTDNDEANPKSGCQDGLDNDRDGLIDLADPGCSTAQDNNEGDGTSQCQDTLDNDRDGFVDLADPGCSSPTDNNEGDGTSQCQDGIDNDQDGLIDLADPGCANAQDGNEVDDTSRLQITTECVNDNRDGTFTAYFSYENNLGAEATVVTDPSKGTSNAFVPPLPAGGFTTVFKVGRQRGALAVVFNGDLLTWTVQVSNGVRSSATASRLTRACLQVQPVAECIDSNATGLLGTFGYVNPNEFAIRMPLGGLNTFSNAPLDRGQPTTLSPGTNKGVFVVPFKDTATWNLGFSSATVNASTPVCVGGCVGTSTTGIKKSLDDAAIRLAQLATQAATYLENQAKRQLSQSASARVSADVTRSKRRAAAFLMEAQSLTIGFPEVIRSCPNAAQICTSVDNGPVIERLRGLYQQLRKMTTRSVARSDFRVDRNTSNTRANALITQSKAAQEAGIAALAGFPRTSTQCK